MKNIIMVFFILCGGFAMAQQEVPKRVNLIIVTPADTSDLFKKTIRLLAEHGYTIDRSDPVSGVIVTQYKDIKNYYHQVSVTVIDGRLYIKSKAKVLTSFQGDTVEMDGCNCGGGSWPLKAFRVTLALVQGLGNLEFRIV